MLPPNAELETKAVLKQLARANRTLAELNFKVSLKLMLYKSCGALSIEWLLSSL